MKWVEFKMRMQVIDEADAERVAEECRTALSHTAPYALDPIVIVEGSVYEVLVSTPGSYKQARGILSNMTGESGADAIRRIRDGYNH